MCDPVVFLDVTPEAFAEIAVNVEKLTGVRIGADTVGTLDHSGCTMQWAYWPSGQQLSVQCMAKPFFVSCDTVNDKLNELFHRGI